MRTGPRSRVCIFAPVPPPVIGSSVAVQSLLRSRLAEEYALVHINTVYSNSVSDVGAASMRKLVRSLRYTLQLWRLLRSADPPGCVILVPTFSVPTFLRDAVAAAVVKRQPGTKLVLWMHSARVRTVLAQAGARWRAMIRRTLARADHLVVLGPQLERQLDGLVDPARVSIIPNGVAVTGCRRADCREPVRPVSVLFLSQMLESKGWRELLDAATTVCASRTDVRFDFYGEPGPGLTVEGLRDVFAAASRQGRIQYHGAVYGEAKTHVMASSDIFCLPTAHEHEALPIALLEAMAAGLAIVASRIGSVPDAALPEGAILVEPRKPDQIAAAVTLLLEDRGRLAAMGDFNRRRAVEHFSEETVARKWTTLLDTLVTRQ